MVPLAHFCILQFFVPLNVENFIDQILIFLMDHKIRKAWCKQFFSITKDCTMFLYRLHEQLSKWIFE